MSDDDPIWNLKELKDRILAFFRAHTQLEEGVREMWCSDCKEMYYTALLARESLSRLGDYGAAKSILAAAAGRCEQVLSEVRGLGESGLALEKELKAAFVAYQDTMQACMPDAPAPDLEAAPARVVKKSEEEYELPCSVCGKRAVAVHPPGARSLLEGIVLAGITRSVGLKLKDKERIMRWLAHGDLASLHKYVAQEEDIDGGLDAYCPQCDRIYCRVHYDVREEWDEGFYDCSRGVCPLGHSPLVDD